MKKLFSLVALAAFCAVMVLAADEAVSVVHGIVTKVDEASKTIAVKTQDGAEETYRMTPLKA